MNEEGRIAMIGRSGGRSKVAAVVAAFGGGAMTSLDAVTAWVSNYRKAWESNDPVDIADLFTEDAAYFSEPFAQPWVGREAIVANWLEHQDPAGSTTFEWHPLIVTEELAIIEATTTYPDEVFSNLWVIRLDNLGQARQFTEWWMKHPTDQPDA